VNATRNHDTDHPHTVFKKERVSHVVAKSTYRLHPFYIEKEMRRIKAKYDTLENLPVSSNVH